MIIETSDSIEIIERDEEEAPETAVEEERVYCGRACKTCVGCICKRYGLMCTEECLCPSSTCRNKTAKDTLGDWKDSSSDFDSIDYKDEYLHGHTKITFSSELEVFLELLENNGILNHNKYDTNRYKKFKCSKAT